MEKPTGILIIEDSPSLALTYQAYLKELRENVRIAKTGMEAFSILVEMSPSVILLDLHLPDMHGLEILDKLKAENHPAAIIVITAHGTVRVAVEAMQRGAIDFLLKPFAADRLRTTVSNAIKLYKLHQKVEELKERRIIGSVGNFIGTSPPMQAVYDMISDAAPSRASVFIIGESGTGKELCATAVHELSPRAEKPLVALNCAAIPENLMESEIFGHIKGAFTGATEDRIGAAVRADGGTLFLDEICEMPMDLQAKLLRFIQTGQISPVGSSQIRKVDVRFVCATNRHPFEAVQTGDFREDLYYRLHVIPIVMPPLRDRGDDVLLIAESMLKRFTTEENRDFKELDDEAKVRLIAHTWPGNVRELGNVIQSAVVLHNGEIMTAQMIERILGSITQPLQPVEARPLRAPDFKTPKPMTVPEQEMSKKPVSIIKTGPVLIPIDQNAPSETDLIDPEYSLKATLPVEHTPRIETIKPLEDVERQAIEDAIAACNGRVREAARHLQVNPSTLYRKLAAWEKKPAE